MSQESSPQYISKKEGLNNLLELKSELAFEVLELLKVEAINNHNLVESDNARQGVLKILVKYNNWLELANINKFVSPSSTNYPFELNVESEGFMILYNYFCLGFERKVSIPFLSSTIEVQLKDTNQI